MKKITTLLLIMLISLLTVATFHLNSRSTSLAKNLIFAAVDDDDDFNPPSTPANPLKTPGSNG